MKKTSQIGMAVAAGVVSMAILAAAAPVTAADATKPTYNSYRTQRSGPNDNDYHANYHADYSATQDGRPAEPSTVDERPTPRQNYREFQTGDHYLRWQHGRRR